eukprot:1717000-Lingulodinium_polyedra.AAC.1
MPRPNPRPASVTASAAKPHLVELIPESIVGRRHQQPGLMLNEMREIVDVLANCPADAPQTICKLTDGE